MNTSTSGSKQQNTQDQSKVKTVNSVLTECIGLLEGLHLHQDDVLSFSLDWQQENWIS